VTAGGKVALDKVTSAERVARVPQIGEASAEKIHREEPKIHCEWRERYDWRIRGLGLRSLHANRTCHRAIRHAEQALHRGTMPASTQLQRDAS
jgi:hypothetical protein